LDQTGSDLKVAHCVNAACSGTSGITPVDLGPGGYYTSIAIGTDGRPVVAYLDQAAQALRLAHCANLACSGTATFTNETSTVDAGFSNALTIDVDGTPIVAGTDAGGFNLSVTRFPHA
jgi:hypothetical protein